MVTLKTLTNGRARATEQGMYTGDPPDAVAMIFFFAGSRCRDDQGSWSFDRGPHALYQCADL